MIMSALLRRFALLAAMVASPAASNAQSSLPAQLSDKEFWQLFSSASEQGGSFPSENFISNEMTYQHVIPSLQKTVRPGDVYLGVGPEQNYTYIANLNPRMAVIFDIRRQNAMAHLMYKALFELSATRAEFLSRLFSRPIAAQGKSDATAQELFAAIGAASANDSLFDVNEKAIFNRLTKTHGFAIDSTDMRSIRHVYVTFFEAGTDINYAYRTGFPTGFSQYPTLGQLQTLTNATGENMAFLATEARYQAVRAMHVKNLIVPVVGDFAGPKAIRAVGAWLKERKANVAAFYLSNVEQYLWRQPGVAEAFYENVAALPTDSTSMFIRSVPPVNPIFSPGFMTTGNTNAASYSVQLVDSGGVSLISVTKDSAGQRVTTKTVDSSANRPRSPLQVFRSLQPGTTAVTTRVALSGLVSGTMSIREALEGYRSGLLTSYNAVVSGTKVDGWK
jgi:hypothetical protein